MLIMLWQVSVRRHTTFGLFPCERWQPAESKKEDVLYHHVQYTLEKRALRFRIRAGDVSLSDIKLAQDSKVDNTGNVCVWPSEEVLAFYCVTDAALCKQLQGKVGVLMCLVCTHTHAVRSLPCCSGCWSSEQGSAAWLASPSLRAARPSPSSSQVCALLVLHPL